MRLALRMVEPPCAGPSVRTAVDGLVAVNVGDAPELTRQQLGEFVPRHGDELVCASTRARARPAMQPTAPNGRRGDTGAVTERAGKIAEQGRGVGIALQGCDRGYVAGFDASRETAPMGEARREVGHEASLGPTS